MALVVQAERWCEVPVPAVGNGKCQQCRQAALAICEGCGAAVCDAHELVCEQCGRTYCSRCEHACLAGKPLPKAA